MMELERIVKTTPPSTDHVVADKSSTQSKAYAMPESLEDAFAKVDKQLDIVLSIYNTRDAIKILGPKINLQQYAELKWYFSKFKSFLENKTDDKPLHFGVYERESADKETDKYIVLYNILSPTISAIHDMIEDAHNYSSPRKDRKTTAIKKAIVKRKTVYHAIHTEAKTLARSYRFDLIREILDFVKDTYSKKGKLI